jgi:hypothetical protein
MIHIDYSNIKVGDAVYIASDDRRDAPYVAVVTKIGRKYITATQRPDCDWDKGRQFSNENGLMKEWGQYRLYPSKEFYESVVEYKEKESFIYRRIAYALNDASFDEIDTIYNIVKKHTKN